MYIMGYNFMTDSSAIDPAPSKIPMINGVKLENAIFDHYNLLNDGSLEYDPEIPEEWTNTTVMNANFENNINAGNLDYSTEELHGIRIKRREKGTFEWLTLYDIIITDIEHLDFTRYDLLNKHGVTYEYALVPYLNDGTECSYIIKDIESTLDGIFVCSPFGIAKFYGGIGYGNANQINRTGVFEPLGTRYPIVVSNAATNYYHGSFSSTLLSFNQLMSDTFNRVKNTNYAQNIVKFLVDKSTKIIKDWNGNIWLSSIIDDVNINYDNNLGMGLANVSFKFVEIGSAIDYNTLFTHGFINLTFEEGNHPEHSPIIIEDYETTSTGAHSPKNLEPF